MSSITLDDIYEEIKEFRNFVSTTYDRMRSLAVTNSDYMLSSVESTINDSEIEARIRLLEIIILKQARLLDTHKEIEELGNAVDR